MVLSKLYDIEDCFYMPSVEAATSLLQESGSFS